MCEQPGLGRLVCVWPRLHRKRWRGSLDGFPWQGLPCRRLLREFVTHHKVKQRLVGDGVRVVIVSELSMGDIIGPRSGVVPTEDPKVHLNFLIYPFGLPIRLGVVGSGEGEVVFQEFPESSSEGGSELGASVRDDFVVEAKVEVYFVEKECGDAFSSDVFLRGTENHPLCKPMVDHDQERIETGRDREVSDEVAGDLLERAGCRGVNGGEWWDGGMGISLVLLAGCTAFNVFVDVGGKARPPEFCRDELMGFQVARVSGTFVVMATLENSMMEGVVIWDIDTTLIGQDARVDLPIGEVGTEGKRDVVVHGLEGLKDEGVTCGGRLDTVGEGDVNNIDKEGWRKESNSIIVVVRVGREVGTAREGVRTGKEFSRDVDHFQVEVSKVDEPMSLPSVEVLGGTEVSEVFMVGEDLDREGGSVEVVVPRFQGADDGEEPSVIDVVVLFCWGERLGEVGTGMPFAI